MTEIRKIMTLREVLYSELGHKPPRPVVRAVGIGVIRNPFAGRWVEDLRELFEAGAALGERLMPQLVELLDGPAVSNVKVAAPGTLLDVPLGHKDEPWSFEHFDTVTVSVADAPRPDEIVVVMAIADGGRLHNRCGAAPIR